jgi:hypothetical protein
MKTDDLIAQLADAPIETRSVGTTLALGLGAGAVVSFVAMLLWLHPRPDLATAIFTMPFWMKLAYAASLAGLAFPVVARLARPVGTAERSDFLLLLPVLLLAAVAAFELAGATPAQRMHLMMGASSSVCPWRIIALSMPVFAGVAIAMRALAPTRLVLAGAAAGLLAGAVGTVIYALHCDESAAPFVVIWYTFGMTMVGVLGGILGRALLRWQ